MRGHLPFVIPGQWVVTAAACRLASLLPGRRAEEQRRLAEFDRRWAEEVAADEQRRDKTWRIPSGGPAEDSAAPPPPVRHMPRLATLSTQGSWVTGFVFSPDGRTLATMGEKPSLALWDVTDPSQPSCVATLDRRRGLGPDMAFSPDGQVLAMTASVDDDDKVWVLDVRDPHRPVQTSTISGHSSPLYEVAFRPVGRLLATGSWDHTVQLWDVADPAHPVPVSTLSSHAHHFEGPGLAFSPDGTILATPDWSETVLLWDITDPTRPVQLASLPVPDCAFSMIFSPDGRTLVTSGATVIVWDVTDPARPRAGATMYRGLENSTNAAFSPDGRTLAVGGTYPDMLLWDISDPARPVDSGLRVQSTGGVIHAVFSPDGRVLATTSRMASDTSLMFWDLR